MCWWIKPKQEEIKKIELKPYGTIPSRLMMSILTAKLAEMGDTNDTPSYLPDKVCKVFKKSNVVEFLSLDETDKIAYIAEEQDCDDFAAELFGKGVPLLWTNKHALNWFVDEVSKLWFIEPQTDKIAKDLEDWQGWDVRFFLGR